MLHVEVEKSNTWVSDRCLVSSSVRQWRMSKS
jgi:hypothetical protein